MLRSFSTEGNQEKERIDMDQEQKKGGWPSRWNNPFPVKKNRPSQLASGKAVDRDPSVQSQCLLPSQLNLLASFGLSREDLETLSHFPDDQLTPENMPLLLQAIQQSKLAPKAPAVPSNCPEKETPQSLRQCIEEETLLSADDYGCIVKKKVIDYGHKSKYGYNEAVPVVKGSSTVANESKEGFHTPKAASGPVAAPFRVTSNPKSPSKELPGQPGFQTSSPSAQAKPPMDVAPKVLSEELGVPANVPPVMQPAVLPIPKPVPAKIRPLIHPVVPPVPKPARIPVLPIKTRARDQRPPPFAPKINKTLSSHDRFEHASSADPVSRPCEGAGGQKNFWVEEPIRSPFGVVKASWLPTFLQRDAPVIKLPTASQMDDYFAVTPKIFPHVCSLCNEDCEDKMGWIQHQNTTGHMINCRWLVQSHPGWTPDISCLSNRHEDHKQERHQSRQCSASPSPKRSRFSDHSGHQTPSQSRSQDSHRTSQARSQTPSQSESHDSHGTSRARSRTPSQSSHDSHRMSRARSRTPSQSSHDSHRMSRARSRTPSQSRSHDSNRRSRARSRTRSRSRNRDSHRMSRARSRTRSRSRNRDSHRMSRARSRTRSRSRNRDSHRMSRARSRTRSRSRSHGYRRTSRARSRSPKRLSSPRHRSKSPRQFQNSSGRSSSSKERGSGSSSQSSEGQHAMAPSSRKKQDERKQTDSSSDGREKRREDSEPTREDASCQKQSVDKTGGKKETHKKLVPEGQSHEEPERLALASLTEKSVLQAMAQLQAQGAAEGSLNQGRSSAELAAGVTDTSTVSSDLVSMIQRVATQVITAVLDSREASATRARTRTGAPEPQKASSATRKAKSQSVAPREGTARSCEAKGKSLRRPCPQKGTSLSGEAKNKQEAGLCPKADKAKNRPKAGACHKERTSLCSKTKNEPAVNPGISLGTAAKVKKENKCVAGQRSKQAVALSDKTEKESGKVYPHQVTTESVGCTRTKWDVPPPSHSHQVTTERDKVENQGVLGACPQQGAPESSKSENQSVVIVCPQQGVPVSCTSKNQGVTGACPQQGSSESSTSKNQDVVGVCPQQGVLESSISKTQGVAGVFPQQGTPKSSMSKNQGVAVVCPLQGASVSCMSKNQGVVGANPQRDVPESSTLKNPGMVGVCPQQGAPESSTSKKESVAGVCPQQGAPVSCTSKNQGVVIVCPQQGVPVSCTSKNQGVAGACPQKGTSVSSTSKIPVVVGRCPQQSTPESSMSKNQGVAGACPQQGASASSTSKIPVLVGGCPQQSTPESSMSKNQGVAGACPNQGTPANSKSENQGMASHSLNKDTARNGQAKCLHVVGCSPNKGTAGSGATENKCPEVPSTQQQISLNSKRGSQDTELKLVPGNICPRSGSIRRSSKPRVWICGDSLVVSAHKRASGTAAGSQLGLEKSVILEWQKEDSLKWIQLKPFLQNVMNCHQVPDVLIIHLGEEDLAHVMKYDFLSRVKGEFTLFAKLAPQLRVIWSDIIPPGVWHKEYERSKLAHFNSELSLLILQQGGAVIKHPQFSPEVPKLYIEKTKLSDAGLDIFLNDIKNGIRAHVLQPSRASGALAGLDLSSKGASSMQTNPGEASVSTQPVRNEAQNSGVASPSSQPGTSGTCKAEKRNVNQGLVVGGIPFCLGSIRRSSKPRVWICGDSLVVSAHKRASGTAAGSQLGLEKSVTLEWHGQDNLTWTQLLPFFQDLLTGCQAPNLVIVHLGEEDLAEAAKLDLVNRVRGEFTLLTKLFPRAKVIWSEIIPQGFWCGKDGYWARKRLNLALGLPLESYGGAVLKHPRISSEDYKLYIDKATLSDAGLDIFLEDIKNGICAHLLQSRKAASGRLSKPMSSPPPAPPAAPAGLSSVSQKVAPQASEVVSSSEEASSMQTDSREATVSSQPVGNKAKNSGGASPSPQPGTFGACKAEKQDLERSLISGNVLAPCSATREQVTKPRAQIFGDSLVASAQKLDLEKRQRGEICFTFTDTTREQVTKPQVQICGDSLVASAQKLDLEKRQRGEICFTFTDTTREQVTKPRVWICGDSLVVSAQKLDLEKRQRGELDQLQQRVVVEWHGQEGLTWTQLVPTLQNLAAQGQAPDVLIIHLGKKDLLSTPWLELSRTIKTEVASLKEAFPKVRLIWSELLPQPVCPAPGEACEAEKVLKEANLFVGELISSFGGAVIKHPETSNSFPVLKINGDGLSHVGLELFLENIRNGIRVHVLQESGKTRPGINAVSPLFTFAPLLPPAGLGSVSQEGTLQGTQGVSFSSEVFPILSNEGDAAMSTLPDVPAYGRRNMQTFTFGSSPFCSRKVRHRSKPRVWICGDSLVVSAQKRASGTAAGSQLGLEESVVLEWHGQDSLKWIQLLPFLQTLVTGRPAPNVLIIHLGEEDLAQAVKHNLVNRVIREFYLLKKLFRGVRVIWSEVIPLGVWPGDEGCLEREALNSLRESIESQKGAVIKHCRLSPEDPELYIDKAELSDAGLDIFLEDLKNGICAHVLAARSPTGFDFLSQKVATQTGEAASSPEEASVMQTDTREVTVSPQTVSSENSGEASPSTQPEPSGTCKTEKQDVVKSVPPCPGSPGPPCSKPRIWIVGHAAVFLAQERADTSGIGSQLGLEDKVVLEWYGYNGLSWVELIPLLQDLATYYRPPDVLIIHLGENDLMFTLSVDFLIRRIKEELHLVRQLFPSTKVMWSDMMRWGSDLQKPNAVNISVGMSVEQFGGAVIEHPRISSEVRYFDDENLRNTGLDIFLEDLKAGICTHVLQSRWPARGRLNKGTRLPASGSPAAPVARDSVSQKSAIKVEEASSAQTDVGEPAVSCKAEQSSVASPSLQRGTSENQDVEEELVPGDIPPHPGEAAVSPQRVSIKAEISGEAYPSPQPGTSGTIKVEKQDEELVSGSALDPSSGGAAVSPQPMSSEAEISGEAGPSPQPETSRTCKAEKQDEELVSGSTLDPCSGGAAVSPQPVSSEAEISGEAGPSPQPETSRTCKAEKQDEELVSGSTLDPCSGGAAVSPQPVSIKAEISGEAGPSPQPETSRTCKAEKQDEELVSGSTLDPCSGGAAVSPQPVSSEAEISGEAGPSPQPETSRACKAEKQEVKLEPVSEHVLAPCPGNPEPASKRRVWICGQSVVTSAEKQASSTEAGSQLGLEESAILEWHGQEGLTWTQLVPTLQNLAAEGQAPDVLIIHLGEEDTECHRAAHLNDVIKKELVLVKEFFPLVRILWSNVLLRRRGCGTGGSRTVNRARTLVNQEMGHFIGTLGGAVIDHPAILHTDPDFYTDGDNLSCRGLDIFLEDTRRAILAHLHSC